MKIIVSFLNGSRYWQDLVLENAAKASAALSDPKFIAKVRTWPGFDFTSSTPAQVGDVLEDAGDVVIKVGFYKGWWWSRAIGYEQDGAIYFNTRKEAYGAGGVGNIAHEVMHFLGFSHDGNSPAGQENTVPWRIGQWAADWEFAPKGCAVTQPEPVA
jgi:hypothetical protein